MVGVEDQQCSCPSGASSLLVLILIGGIGLFALSAGVAPSSAGASGEFVVAAAGDVACEPDRAKTNRVCHEDDVADLIESLSPSAVLALGTRSTKTANSPTISPRTTSVGGASSPSPTPPWAIMSTGRRARPATSATLARGPGTRTRATTASDIEAGGRRCSEKLCPGDPERIRTADLHLGQGGVFWPLHHGAARSSVRSARARGNHARP